MAVKISELPNLEVGDLTTISSIVPVVANLGATITTYNTSMANVKTYVETGNLSITGTLTTAGVAEFQNNVTVLGGLVVAGNVTYSGSNNLIISDNIIELHVANAANVSEPWTVDDGKDIGIRFHYYSTQNDDAALVFSHDEKDFEFYDSGVLGTNVFVGNSYGKIRAGQAIFVNATPTTGNGTGTLQSHGGAAVTGNLWVGGLSTLTGNITSSGNLIIAQRVLATGNIVTPARMSTGNLNVNSFATVGTTLVAGGNTTVQALTVNGSATVGTTLGIGANANIGGGANIAGSATIGSTLGVTGIIRGASIQNTPIGTTTEAAGKFTTLITTGISTLGADVTVTGNVNPSADVTYYLGNTNNRWETIFANTITANATTALYADLAEKYVPDQYYDPGTVVVFGGENEITVTDQQGDTRVAGAISTQPAYVMNEGEENGIPLALRGKVPVKVVGSVNKGDLLITSNTAGYATAAKYYDPNPNAVFAKSLEHDNSTEPRVIWAVIL